MTDATNQPANIRQSVNINQSANISQQTSLTEQEKQRMLDMSQPKLVLAPMEGLTDPLMRQILTEMAQLPNQNGLEHKKGYDWCVSEFIRVTGHLLPAHVIYKYCPEAFNGWKTASGTPIHIQFLGSDPQLLAENACFAQSLGAPVIDLNFGCPAKTVNKHRGGAVLLDEPKLMYDIIHAVRKAVPKHTPVSAKIRLGYQCTSRTLDVAHAVYDAGASWLTIHARTKTQGYKPPAYWSSIRPVVDAIDIPVFANGEIWTPAQAQDCQHQSGCQHLMLGRGAVTRPDLVDRIHQQNALQANTVTQTNSTIKAMTWQDIMPFLQMFLQGNAKSDKALIGRFKQWFGMLTKGYDEADALWQQIKKMTDKEAIISAINKIAN